MKLSVHGSESQRDVIRASLEHRDIEFLRGPGALNSMA